MHIDYCLLADHLEMTCTQQLNCVIIKKGTRAVLFALGCLNSLKMLLVMTQNSTKFPAMSMIPAKVDGQWNRLSRAGLQHQLLPRHYSPGSKHAMKTVFPIKSWPLSGANLSVML